MIELGAHDTGVSQDALVQYEQLLKKATRLSLAEIADGVDKLKFHTHAPDTNAPMSVSQVQGALRELGFFPGGSVDGVVGYRTLSAIRLFQEYVRTVEKLPSLPDGLCGKGTQGHIQRWLDNGLVPDWTPTVAKWKAGTLAGTEYNQWLALGEKVQAKYAAQPNRMLKMVGEFSGATDTKKVGEWDFDPKYMHLIGVRRSTFSTKFDDVFIFLMKGLVFKFQGSTEPGSTKHPDGRPFLVQGQHDYHFGWHQQKYLALRPQRHGVLVVRSKDARLDDGDLDRGLSANTTINIHWAGKGLTRDVSTWSEGCQVITGSLYLDHHDQLVDCGAFTAVNNGALSNKLTRGAYNMLSDLATALSSDMETNTVKYLLLTDEDVALDPGLAKGLGDARTKVVQAMK